MNAPATIVTRLLDSSKLDARAFIHGVNRNLTPEDAYRLARRERQPRPDLEPIIAEDGVWSFMYAVYVLQARFPMGEPAIATDQDRAAYNYNFGTDL